MPTVSNGTSNGTTPGAVYMGLSATTINAVFSATDSYTVGSTEVDASTSARDVYAFSNGTGATQAQAVIDPYISIASNSTVTTLGNLTTTSGKYFAYTSIKGLRLFNDPLNGNVTISSNITGFPNITMLPGSSLFWSTSNANGWAINANNTITANGVTGNIIVITMLVS